MNILFTVQTALDVTTLPTVRLIVEVNYLRNITDDDGAKDFVPSTIRIELDKGLNGSILLEGADPDRLEANVLSVDGSSLVKKVLSAAREGTASLTLSAADISLIENSQQAIPKDITPLTIVRTVRLVPTGSVKVNYVRSSVAVVPIVDAAALTASNVDTLLKSGGSLISSLEVTGQNLSTLKTLTWNPTHLAVDGTFTAFFIQQNTIGWLWWLIGEREVLGFVPDNLNAANNKTLVIALPALSSAVGMNTSSPEKGSDRGSGVPANVTEAEVANNPDIYTEDPGAFCRPFSNPERVLSERRFSVIARITQPEIGPLSSVKTKSMALLNLEGNIGGSVFSNGAIGRSLLSFFRPNGKTLLPAGLADAMTPVRHNLVGRYVDLLKRLPSGRTNMDANHPLQWEDDIAQYQTTTVAIGHILEFGVRWRSNGYSLGTVAKTLTLAPRQTKRIQKIEWERSERARRRERTELRDQENDSTVRERDYSDSVAANLREWASGGSHSDTAAAAAGIGFFAGGFLGGIGGGAGSANSSSHQEGGRDTTASERQRLHDAIRRHGDALRKFESTVVNEVAQEETVTGTTEVIRNANYAHSLTVIYYQILRHLKVTTEFSGVRECIFVPFAIKPFDVQRAYRWREALQSFIRLPLYSRALRYLKDVITNFNTSDIAPGPRALQQLTYLRGSIYVSLGVERPHDTVDSSFDPSLWQVVQPLLETPASEIHSTLLALSPAQRDRRFQTEYAPSVAAQWANKIQLRLGGRVLSADCTLASRYQFNRSVRIDFVIPANDLMGLSRQTLQRIDVTPALGLPPGSVANLTRISITYNTSRFEHSVEGQTGTNGLITPVNGTADGATIVLPLDSWERVDEQLEIRRSVNQLIEHLNEHVEYYHKAIWWRMDRDRLMMLLDGFYIPNTNNVSIASVVDREPVGIIGNSLVYRVGAASFLGYGKVTKPEELYNLYAQKEPVSDPLLISLPTDGLYAQTILDECAALEEHYGNTDWVLNDKDPDLGTIDPSLLQSRRVDQTPATIPTTFPGTIINLQNAPDAPAPSGLAGVLNAVSNPNAFRDMAGLASTQANAAAALTTAANLATNFGNQAAGLELAKLAKAEQATKTADQKLASIQKAKEKGLTSDADAAAHAKEVLSAMNPDAPKAAAPHENPAINSAIEAATNIPGSTIEANTGEGGVKVKMGGDGKEDSTSNPLIVEVNVTPALRSFEPGRNFTGKVKLSVKGKDLPSGTQLRWSIPSPESGKYTITQRITASGISEVEITGMQPGVSGIDVEAIDSGVVIASTKYPLSIPQFVAVDDSNAVFDRFFTNNNLTAIRGEIMQEAMNVIQLLLLSEANVRMIWASAGTPIPAHIPARFLTRMSLQNTDPAGTNLYGSSDPGPASNGNVGDTVFDEIVSIFPGSYLVAAAGSDINATTNDLMRIIAGIQVSDPALEIWLIRFFGRMLGETISHEMYHTLLPVAFIHNENGAGIDIDTGDIMDAGEFRSFRERTGIDALSSLPANFISNLTDNSITAINKLTGMSLAHIRAHFPTPPTPPFNI